PTLGAWTNGKFDALTVGVGGVTGGTPYLPWCMVNVLYGPSAPSRRREPYAQVI
ncbi:hypothetical protein LCGC14_2398810, partial [marine sediment metagenome]